MPIKVIAFDADDTLWVNEPYFRDVEYRFCELMEDFLPQHTAHQLLFKIEMDNLPLYGYGIKAFMLSMIETALQISEHRISQHTISRIINLGKEMLNKPIELLDDVEMVLKTLYGKYRLVVATKGDLLDQERKLDKSGLSSYFHHIEIMSDKQEKDYAKLIKHLDIAPDEFLMVGNSLKSDVFPVLKLGGYGFHVPYHTTWQHETVDIIEIKEEKFQHLDTLKDLLKKLEIVPF